MACFCRRYFGSNNFDSDDGHRPTIPSTVQHSVRAARRAHPCDLPVCLGAKAFCVSQEGKTMSQGALVKALAEKLQTTLGQSQEFLNALATIATRELKNRGFVNIPGLCMIKRSVKADALKGRRVPGKTRRVQMRVRVLPAAALKKAMKRRSGAQETHEKVLKNATKHKHASLMVKKKMLLVMFANLTPRRLHSNSAMSGKNALVQCQARKKPFLLKSKNNGLLLLPKAQKPSMLL